MGARAGRPALAARPSKENAVLTLWLKEIAPSPALRKWFGQDPTHWAELGRRHRAELARDDEAVAR